MGGRAGVTRIGRLVAFAILIGIGISHVVWSIGFSLDDWAIYRDAAERILAGQPLYSGADALHSYRYAPWFAYAVVPFAFLPGAVWGLFMLAGSALALIPLARDSRPEARLLLVMFAPILFAMSASGNVQGPMLAALVWGIPTRWAWAAIGFAASLKVTPILFAAVLVAERRWWQAFGAGAVAVALWAPLAWMNGSPETFEAGAARLFPLPIYVLVSVAAVAGLAWVAWRRSAFTPLAAGVGAVITLPRLFLYDVTLLVPSATDPRDPAPG